MFRTTLMLALALTAAPLAEAGKGFSLNISGGRVSGVSMPGVNISHGGVRLVGHTQPKHIVPKPPICLPKPPIVIPPKPPICLPKPPIVIPPRPPIVLPPAPPVFPPRPPVCLPKPPIVLPPPPVVCPPPVLKPICPPTPPVCHCEHTCHCSAGYQWYFGMACERVQTPFGVGLRLVAVTPAGPAQSYGLKVGDVLLLAGSVNLSQASSNTHGVTLIQQAVTAEGTVQLTLVDGVNQSLRNLVMAPTPLNQPAPTAAPIALNPAQPTATM